MAEHYANPFLGRHMTRKKTKAGVGFEHPAKGEDRCGECAHFQAPESCERVQGYIQPEDWCRLFRRA